MNLCWFLWRAFTVLKDPDIVAKMVGEDVTPGPDPYRDSGDSRSSFSPDDAQAGVKNIEAVSQTWTKWSLIVAYLG